MNQNKILFTRKIGANADFDQVQLSLSKNQAVELIQALAQGLQQCERAEKYHMTLVLNGLLCDKEVDTDIQTEHIAVRVLIKGT